MGILTQFTPGPWRACKDGKCPCGYIFGDGGQVYVAKILDLGDDVDPVASEPQRRFNTCLVAAAPEMFTALERLVGICNDNGFAIDDDSAVTIGFFLSAVHAGEAALRKARGVF